MFSSCGLVAPLQYKAARWRIRLSVLWPEKKEETTSVTSQWRELLAHATPRDVYIS